MIHTSLVVTAYNRSALLSRSLVGYRRYAPYAETELVLVDDGSTDGHAELVPLALEVFERVQRIVIDRTKSAVPINPRCCNPALGLNVGVRHALGDLILMTPPECYPLADNIHNMQLVMEYGAKRTFCFGRAVKAEKIFNDFVDANDWLPSSEEDVRSRVPGAIDKPIISESGRRAPWPYFAAFRKLDHADVRGFDEEFLRGYAAEDDDFAERMAKSGVPLAWDDRCSVLHQWHPPVGKSIPPEDYQVNVRHLQSNRVNGVIVANTGHDFGSAVLRADVYTR